MQTQIELSEMLSLLITSIFTPSTDIYIYILGYIDEFIRFHSIQIYICICIIMVLLNASVLSTNISLSCLFFIR